MVHSHAEIELNKIQTSLRLKLNSLVHELQNLYAEHTIKPDDNTNKEKVKSKIAEITLLVSKIQEHNKSIGQTSEEKLREISEDRKSLLNENNNLNLQLDAIDNKNTQFISAQHLGIEVNRLYRRQKKIMWIYIILLVILIAACGYLFYRSYTTWGGKSASISGSGFSLSAVKEQSQRQISTSKDSTREIVSSASQRAKEATDKLSESLNSFSSSVSSNNSEFS